MFQQQPCKHRRSSTTAARLSGQVPPQTCAMSVAPIGGHDSTEVHDEREARRVSLSPPPKTHFRASAPGPESSRCCQRRGVRFLTFAGRRASPLAVLPQREAPLESSTDASTPSYGLILRRPHALARRQPGLSRIGHLLHGVHDGCGQGDIAQARQHRLRFRRLCGVAICC